MYAFLVLENLVTIPQQTVSKEGIVTKLPRQHLADCPNSPLQTKFIKYLKDSETITEAPKVRVLTPLPRHETVLQCFDYGRPLLAVKGAQLVDGILGAMIGQ